VRPVIQKKVPKKDGSTEETKPATTDAKDDAVMVDAEVSDEDFDIIDADEGAGEKAPPKKAQPVEDDNQLSEFDVKYGCAHGYWKDLLNILSLAANDELKVDGDPHKVFNIDDRSSKKRTRGWTEGRKKTTPLSDTSVSKRICATTSSTNRCTSRSLSCSSTSSGLIPCDWRPRAKRTRSASHS